MIMIDLPPSCLVIIRLYHKNILKYHSVLVILDNDLQSVLCECVVKFTLLICRNRASTERMNVVSLVGINYKLPRIMLNYEAAIV